MSSTSTSALKPPWDYLKWIRRALLILVVPIVFWMANKHTYIDCPLLHRELPAYHIILPSDIFMERMDINFVSTKMVREIKDLIGHYTLSPVLPNQPILESQIGPKPDPSLISNTLAVAIPANSTTTIGGNLHAGDIVSMAAVPLSNTTSLLHWCSHVRLLTSNSYCAASILP
jgi:hypothetical protein